MPYNNVAERYTQPLSERWVALYDDIAFVTYDKPTFKITDLINQCETIKLYAPKTQGDILRAHVRSHTNVDGDRLVRVIPNQLIAWQYDATN